MQKANGQKISPKNTGEQYSVGFFIQSQTRTNDVKLQIMQIINIKAITAITGVVNDKAALDQESLLTRLTDALALLDTANIDLYRREINSTCVRIRIEIPLKQINPSYNIIVWGQCGEAARENSMTYTDKESLGCPFSFCRL